MVRSKLSFFEVTSLLPREIVSQILQEWMAPQCLIVMDTSPDSFSDDDFAFLEIKWACDSDAEVESSEKFPAELKEEYWRIRHLSWLKAPKVFTSPYDFYVSHYALSLSKPPPDKVPYHIMFDWDFQDATIDPLIQREHHHLNYHGLERIVLDFSASEYFALFNVHLPPFLPSDEDDFDVYPDLSVEGAAALLEHTRDLNLTFGDSYEWAHPWAEVEHPRFAEARYRPKVCDSGLLIDWILEFAWHGGFIQHIPTICLEGDVQEWVKRKWNDIFARHQAHPGRTYRPKEHFPPRCKCDMPCWRMFGGKVIEAYSLTARMNWKGEYDQMAWN
ncbi:hypothetical protein EK21DRAFT_51971 [Setomelanomma holmii]|uniref:Uncharacterized protein n=1 Tax=Setomelanomma holmii TaxID=210430 RepID=A0A9P4LQP9_9PLEO|nr:hypothetical protein EK21DRAFT_51971 [Setomelanomma holmii]